MSLKHQLTPEILLNGYCSGIFPMAEHQSSPDLFWVNPKHRGILPLDGFHMSRSLRRALSQQDYVIRANTAFQTVVTHCADRDETWINDYLFSLYDQLHQASFAHSLEVWRADELIGGVFGVSIGGAFFGESMFSSKPNASKLALAYLVVKLANDGFALCDTQFLTPHLKSLGGREIAREAYLQQLSQALDVEATFRTDKVPTSEQVIQTLLQFKSQTS